MTVDTFFITSIAVCFATVVFQVLSYYHWRERGLVIVTIMPFIFNGLSFASMQVPKLCEPRTPGCEMAGIGVFYGVVIVAVATMLTGLSAVMIVCVSDWLWHKKHN